MEKALLVAGAHCQGGHSDAGRLIAENFGIPFPLRMEALASAAIARGWLPADLWPWWSWANATTPKPLSGAALETQEKSVAPAPSEQETRSELLKANLLNSRLYEALKESKALYILGAAVNGRHGEKSIEKADRIYKLIDEALSQAERGRS